MIQLAAASGTTDLVATPHANAEFKFDEERIEEAFESLAKRCSGLLNLYRGCDFHLTLDNLNDALLHPTKYAVNRGCYLLVELPEFMGPSLVSEQLKALLNNRFAPIITHPERNAVLQANIAWVKEWVQKGCLVQITGQSFLGRFGSAARRAAESLMNSGLVHFVASDAHDCEDRTPDLSKAYNHVRSRWGQAKANSLFVDNPSAVLWNEPIVPSRKAKRRFSLFSFGAR